MDTRHIIESAERGTLTSNDYEYFVRNLCKPGVKILEDLTPEKAHLLHMIIGLSGEVGELLDAIKKHCIYNKPLDFDNLVEELGDITFYLTAIMDVFHLAQKELYVANVKKLGKRYQSGSYSNAEAIARTDKQ